MFGLIGKMTAIPGQRDALISILVRGAAAMPGCLSYIVAGDLADPDALWVTEVWESQDRHAASLALPAVQQVIQRGRLLIASFDERFVTEPIGGYGLIQPGTDINVLLKRLSAPAQRAIRSTGLITLEQLCNMTGPELRRLNGIGNKGLAIIRSTLAEHGLSLSA
jgi:quinol monooxygenase YgiN